nr:hypothetical protein [Tanacetum cinerariifolium]
SESSIKKKGRTVVITTEDMHKKINDVKARTTLLLALPDEHQLRFNKYETVKELWEAILKTFGGNEATKKTKKNQLKQQYGNFKAEGSETLEQTFNRLQAISLDDVYNHLKVYEPEVQKKSESNSQNMAFNSSANTSSGKDKINTTNIPTASTQVFPTSADVTAASISRDTTGKKITIQGTDVAGFDKSKVECFNCHKMGDVCTAGEDKDYSQSKMQRPPQEEAVSESSIKKKGRIVVITTEDMHKKINDVKARTTLFLALPDEHQLRFNKYETAKELWEAILKTFGGNEATKKTKKNQLKQQYGNFKAEGSETLEQTFNRLQDIVSHLEFMYVEIEQDDLNQKFLTSLAPEWLMYTIVWRNRDDLDT